MRREASRYLGGPEYFLAAGGCNVNNLIAVGRQMHVISRCSSLDLKQHLSVVGELLEEVEQTLHGLKGAMP